MLKLTVLCISPSFILVCFIYPFWTSQRAEYYNGCNRLYLILCLTTKDFLFYRRQHERLPRWWRCGIQNLFKEMLSVRHCLRCYKNILHAIYGHLLHKRRVRCSCSTVNSQTLNSVLLKKLPTCLGPNGCTIFPGKKLNVSH